MKRLKQMRPLCAGFLLLTSAGAAHSQEGPADRVDRLQERLSAYGYSGAIAIAADGRIVHEKGYGLADRERGRPINSETRFDIGSLTKPFTAAVILRLAELGKLSVGDTLGALLEDVPTDKTGITIHQLLTHTSGLVRSAASLGVEEDAPRSEFLTQVLASDLLYPPDERFEYSDTGYDLLAAVAEVVTGEPYATLLEELVLRPAGLERTAYANDDVSADVAWSYAGAIGTPWNDEREGPSAPSWFNRGSGGLLTTASELIRFESALHDGRILSRASVEKMVLGHVPVSEEQSYGYGWFVTETPHGRLLYHSGDIAGYKAHLGRYVDANVVIAALGNVYGWERVTDRDVAAAWFADGPRLPPAPTRAQDPPAFEGTYRTPAGQPLIVWMEAGRYVVEVAGQEAVDLVFGVQDAQGRDRTADAERIVAALERGDVAFIETRLRDRDRMAGMASRLVSIWNRVAERDGPLRGIEILGSYPAQDGTFVSLVEVERERGRNRLRLIWRGDRLVSAGGDEGLRRPTALFEPTGTAAASRYAVFNGTTTTLTFDRDAMRASEGDDQVVARRDRSNLVEPPPLSIVRTLLPVVYSQGPEAALDRYDRLRATASGRYDFGEEALNDLGYRLLHAGATQAAIAVFRRNVKEYPRSWNAHDSLGEAFLAADRIEEARASYRRSLELNPENERARAVVEGTPEGGP